MIAMPIATFSLVSVLLSPTVTRASASLRFVMFSSNFTICDMALESAINVCCYDIGLIFFDKEFFVDHVFCDIFFRFFFRLFLLVVILFFVIVRF